MTKNWQKQLRGISGTGSTDSTREAREAVETKVHQYMVELAEKRKQAGIISTPSTELLEAERRLAKVWSSFVIVLCMTVFHQPIHAMLECVLYRGKLHKLAMFIVAAKAYMSDDPSLPRMFSFAVLAKPSLALTSICTGNGQA